MRRVVAAVVVIVVSASFVLASAFGGTTVERPEEMWNVEYGWPFAFARSDASGGAALRELRSGEIPFPNAVPFNPWENPTRFDGRAFVMSWAAVSVVLGALLLVLVRLRHALHIRPEQP